MNMRHLRPVIMMIIGLNYILGDLQSAILAAVWIYAAAVWIEDYFMAD